MRILTHNSMQNNSADAKGKGFPLKITSAVEVRVTGDPNPDAVSEKEVAFVTSLLPNLEWNAVVEAAAALGVPSLPPVLTEDLVNDQSFLKALYHILMNVHLIKGILTCPATGREFLVQDGIPNMILEEDECENVRL